MTQQWKLVPVEPTPQMVNAALKVSGIFPQYAAMLAVAPVPPLRGDQEVRKIVTEALVGMVSAVVSATPPPNAPLPDFIQAPVDRAVTRIGEHVSRLQAENAALQQRLNDADQRVDDLQAVVEQVLTNAERGLPPDLHRTLRKLVPEPASTQPVDEAEREPFEAWHRRRFKTKYSTGAPTRDIHGSVPDPNYGPPNQQQMWEAWNARAALLIPRDHEIPGTSFQRLNALANEGE